VGFEDFVEIGDRLKYQKCINKNMAVEKAAAGVVQGFLSPSGQPGLKAVIAEKRLVMFQKVPVLPCREDSSKICPAGSSADFSCRKQDSALHKIRDCLLSILDFICLD